MWAVMAIPSGTYKAKKDWMWIHKLAQQETALWETTAVSSFPVGGHWDGMQASTGLLPYGYLLFWLG